MSHQIAVANRITTMAIMASRERRTVRKASFHLEVEVFSLEDAVTPCNLRCYAAESANSLGKKFRFFRFDNCVARSPLSAQICCYNADWRFSPRNVFGPDYRSACAGGPERFLCRRRVLACGGAPLARAPIGGQG